MAHQLRAVVIAPLCFFLSVVTASAEHPSCVGLRDALSRLGSASASSSGNRADYQRYASMVRQQSRALRSAERDARSFACNGRNRRAGQCAGLVKKIGKMKTNLTKLVSLRDAAKGTRGNGLFGRNTKSEARKIRRQMKRYRCGQDVREASIDRRKRGFFDLLFNGGKRRQEPAQAEEKKYGSTYRTLCVRQCDGYYFPISFATVRGQFASDKAQCSALCPGSETELYAYLNPQEGPEQMVSVSGEPYYSLANAFRYRREVVPSCSCKRSTTASALSDLAQSGVSDSGLRPDEPPSLFGDSPLQPVEPLVASSTVVPPLPIPAVNSAHDLETRMAIVGKFELKAVDPDLYIRNIDSGKQERVYDPETLASTGIRIVGPVFLGDQGSEELLIDPARARVQ